MSDDLLLEESYQRLVVEFQEDDDLDHLLLLFLPRERCSHRTVALYRPLG